MERSDRAAASMPQKMTDVDATDRIFLSSFIYDVEIGAYAEEHGVTQRLRFDIMLEVARNTAHLDDRVGRVINYDDLVNAIKSLAAGDRMNLLETFAERLAGEVLIDPRARRTVIRIDKLDRLPNGATLGVEITRERTPETNERVWTLSSDQK